MKLYGEVVNLDMYTTSMVWAIEIRGIREPNLEEAIARIEEYITDSCIVFIPPDSDDE